MKELILFRNKKRLVSNGFCSKFIQENASVNRILKQSDCKCSDYRLSLKPHAVDSEFAKCIDNNLSVVNINSKIIITSYTSVQETEKR